MAGTPQHDCWVMINTVEELRREEIRRGAGRKVWRMNHLRPKIDREGEVAALEYCALKETEGFREVLGYGLPELTAEAIVLRHPETFGERVRQVARDRLTREGVTGLPGMA